MYFPEDDDDYEAMLDDRHERMMRWAEMYDEDGEEALTAAERNPSMLR